MPDDFNSISNRLLNRCPAAGILLSQQMVNDAWKRLQARREWSWRRGSGIFAPPNLYQTGKASTNVATGSPTLISGSGTAWTPQMVGTQIRLGGLLYPYYTIVQYISPTALLIDQVWAGPDVSLVTYQILQCFFPVPADFNYFYTVVSIKDGYRLWTNITENDLSMLDPQRTNTGQTYATAFKDFTSNYGGTIGPVIRVGGTGPSPVSTTTLGYSYVANATYIIQVVTGGISGTATFQWMRAGQTSFQGIVLTADSAQDMQDGVQIYWPDSASYVSGDIFIINTQAQITSGVPRYELWPAPTFNGYLYPYIYIRKEADVTPQQPQFPPFVANRGDVLLEMSLAQCARYPGADADHPNPYFNLKLADMHDTRSEYLINELERNDEEVGVSNIDFQIYPYYPSPWATGQWQQSHAPFLT